MWYVFGALFLGVLILKALSLYTDYLWFGSVEQGEVFTKIFWTKVKLAAVVGIIFFVWLLANMRLARRPLPDDVTFIGRRLLPDEEREQIEEYADRALLLFALVGAVMAGVVASGQWHAWLQFKYAVPFGETDAVFGKDIGFYVFRLRFIQYLWQAVYYAVVVTFVVSVLLHLYQEAIRVVGNTVQAIPRARAHCLGLLGLALFIKIFGYRLDQFNLLFASRADIFAGGPGYADIHARLPMLSLLMVAAALTGVIIIASIKGRAFKVPGYALGILLVLSFLGGTAYPALVQKLVVVPNQLDKERPYIKHNIAATNKAYALEGVDEVNFDVTNDLSAEHIEDNWATIENIRLWDHRPLQRTNNQEQAIRAYYNFPDVDVDRYTVNGRLRQVMLSSRQINASKLPVQNWVSTHLKYTHGYGLCMSPVNEIVGGKRGMPNYWVGDIPPVGEYGLKVTRPGIYYGASVHPRMIERIQQPETPLETARAPVGPEEPPEGPGGGEIRGGPSQPRRGYGGRPDDITSQTFVIVNTKELELDYSSGGTGGAATENVYTHYDGTGGVQISSFFRRLAFFARFFPDIQILFTTQITDQSRIHINRTVPERMQALAPFLMYDPDPYLVINDDGTLKWIVDAYAISGKYPYSSPIPRLGNYVRNSVKVVCDAYDGVPEYYTIDPNDPLVQCYERIFPSLFKPIEQMSDHLRAHLRYPQLLFMLQVGVYSNYHMKDPQVFFQGEDRWAIPPEVYSIGRRPVEAYYVVLELADEKGPEFVLMMPLVLYGREERGMVAWMAARSDEPHYGELIVYNFPKDKTVDGPWMVENRIGQDGEISRLQTLWGTEGSRVIRGNLLVIPLEQSLLYVEPLYLEAEGGEGLPELRRVILVYGDRVVMGANLEEALDQLFGDVAALPQPREAAPERAPERVEAPVLETLRETLERILALDKEAQEAQERGDFETFLQKNKEQSAALKELEAKLQ